MLSRHPIDIDEVSTVPDAHDFEWPTAVVVVDVPRNGGAQAVLVVPVRLMARCPVCRPFVQGQQREVRSRRREVPAVLPSLDPDLPAIMGGDHNSTPWTQPYRRLVGAGFSSPHRAVGFGLGFTYPGDHRSRDSMPPGRSLAHLPLVSIRLDHVLVRGLQPCGRTCGTRERRTTAPSWWISVGEDPSPRPAGCVIGPLTVDHLAVAA